MYGIWYIYNFYSRFYFLNLRKAVEKHSKGRKITYLYYSFNY